MLLDGPVISSKQLGHDFDGPQHAKAGVALFLPSLLVLSVICTVPLMSLVASTEAKGFKTCHNASVQQHIHQLAHVKP